MADKKPAKKEVKKTSVKKSVSSAKKSDKQRKVAPVKKMGRGKKYLEVAKLVDRDKFYPIAEAMDLAVKSSPVKFDATVEAHIITGLDPKNAEQNIRGAVAMPEGLGKKIKVLVFAEGENAEASKKAGADFVGSDDLIEKIAGGWLGFDVAISTPELMVKIGKLGRTLGTKGLMPNPKTGTVTKDPAKAVEEFKKGKVEFKLDKDAVIHLGFGKVSLGTEKLLKNFTALYKAIMTAKPASAKGTYISKVALATSMGPGVKVDLSSLDK